MVGTHGSPPSGSRGARSVSPSRGACSSSLSDGGAPRWTVGAVLFLMG
ncbi:MAG: hypothetical protein BLITH_0766 [Brockia lithotrophica]|uniref:Uncharacterized protein n=1 Tax=Brockia lithotrophica TaxID=933949 RepID=A0A2T5G8S3_9BACL|nr:MAG: hypothetical protein BLITH_0766 [Brockia lithotrophica]